MKVHTANDDYELLDSGDERKLERFGDYVLERPAGQAVWQPQAPERWARADAAFDRKQGNRWLNRSRLPDHWVVNIAGIHFKLSGTDFGHLGVFPEQRESWEWVRQEVATAHKTRKKPISVLNLFAYSGGTTLAAAQAGAEVCHLDASKGMVDWARENAALNKLADAPIRWIVDDVLRFLVREARRGHTYDGIVLDPPSFGRGKKGEVFKIQRHLPELLRLCYALLPERPVFLLLSCHTPEYSAGILRNLLEQLMREKGGRAVCGEMLLTGSSPAVMPLPNGSFARWAQG
ncbi:MAG: hypothetical protein EOM20_13150 [Spartobacteria bacterium]|nr:hypothetical protein [Spartobacteria bacterium]